MRKFLRAGGAVATALTAALTTGAFTLAPPATRAAAAPKPLTSVLTSIQPGYPLQGAGGSQPLDAASTTSNTLIHANSANWAGHVAGRSGVTFRYVAATFYVPYLNCAGVSAGNPTFSSHWVGLDGFFPGSSTVEQTGILAACYPNSSGVVVPSYAAWWETAPYQPAYPSISIRPGDQITASVYYNKTTRQYRLSLYDNTDKQYFIRSRYCPTGYTCQRSSAEAISEAPYNGSSFLPLADFQAESFSSIHVTNTSGDRGGMSTSWWDYYRVNQVSDGSNTDAGGSKIPAGTPLDTPTSLDTGAMFDNYYRPGT